MKISSKLLPNMHKEKTSNKAFTILWFGGILAFGIVLPIYFTMTESGTAKWLIEFQSWATTKLSGTASWYPVVTGLLTCVIHVFVIIGLVKVIGLLVGIFKK